MAVAAGEELTERENGLTGIFASAQEIDSAKALAKLRADISEEIFRQMGESENRTALNDRWTAIKKKGRTESNEY